MFEIYFDLQQDNRSVKSQSNQSLNNQSNDALDSKTHLTKVNIEKNHKNLRHLLE